MSPTCPCLCPQWAGLAWAAPFLRRKCLRGIQQLWLCCFRPCGYVTPAWWLIVLPFSFIPVDSTICYSWKKNTTKTPELHPGWLLVKWAPFPGSAVPAESCQWSLPSSEDGDLCAEGLDAGREGSEAPAVQSDLLQMCSGPHKPQNWLPGWGRVLLRG